MHTSNNRTRASGQLVDTKELICGGCREDVHGERSEPGFAHRDGSSLCPDRHGRAGEPVEATRFGGGR